MLINQVTQQTPAEGDDELRTLAVAEFLAACRVMQYVQWYTYTGNADAPRKEVDLFGGDNRTIATGYTAKETQPDFASSALKIYGDLVQTDRANKRRGGDIGNQRTKDLSKFCRSLGRYFLDSIINDTLSSTKFKGLKAWCTDLSRNFVLTGATDGYEVPAGDGTGAKAKKNVFMESVDYYIEEVDPDVIYMNTNTIARLGTIGREFMRTTSVSDIYGKAQVVTTYRERPIINTGQKKDKSGLVIPNNETVGANSDCTSIYFVRYGEEENVTMATNVGFDVANLGQVGTKYQTMVELDCDQLVLDPYAIARLSGIRITNN